MRLILLGPPGCGKGTQAAVLAEYLKIPTVSTGEMFRAAVHHGAELGQRAAEFMNRGELVPDELTVGILEERISQKDCLQGFLLDGFPRTLGQAEALRGILQDMSIALDAVVDIALDDEVVIGRLCDRRVCADCGKTYHLVASPPKSEGVCDECGGQVIQRSDDRPDTVRNRLEVYRTQTEPLIGYYRRQGLLKDVDGHGGMDEVQSRIREVLVS